MENVIFVISIVGEKIFNNKAIIGYTNANDRNIIESFIKNIFKISLGKELINEYYYQNGVHWEYETSDDKIFVHVDLCNKIE